MTKREKLLEYLRNRYQEEGSFVATPEQLNKKVGFTVQEREGKYYSIGGLSHSMSKFRHEGLVANKFSRKNSVYIIEKVTPIEVFDEEEQVTTEVEVSDDITEEEAVEDITDTELVPYIEGHAQLIRNQRVMLDFDLARVYGVETKRLNQQRERNPEKFPEDFAFQLSDNELQLQNVTAISSMTRVNPWVYTLEGCNMAATVLNTKIAVKRSVQIIRTFTDLERMAHGEEPKQPGFVEFMQVLVKQNEMLTESITQQGKQLTSGIVALEQKVDTLDVDGLKERTQKVEEQLNDLTDEKKVFDRQKEIDQYIHIDAYFISYKDGVPYKHVMQGLCRKIKGRYLPRNTKVTEIPPRLQQVILDGLHRSVLKRLADNPEYYYRLNDYHQKFLIERGYTDL